MTDTILANHLLAAHPGARVRWFANGYLKVMSPDALERLHAELVRQGEDCRGNADQLIKRARPVRVRANRCRACHEPCNYRNCQCTDECWRRQRRVPPHTREAA